MVALVEQVVLMSPGEAALIPLICTFGLSQKYQKDKADEGIAAKATQEIIHAIRAVRRKFWILLTLLS